LRNIRTGHSSSMGVESLRGRESPRNGQILATDEWGLEDGSRIRQMAGKYYYDPS
jgi:hypothetical protein